MYLTEENKKARRGSRKRETADRASGADAADWARRKLSFSPDAVQEQVLKTQGRRLVMNCTRQWGKSTVTAAKAVHQAYTEAESLTLVVSPSARQTGEFLRKAGDFLRRLNMVPRGDGDNEMSLMLPNRSRIVGVPGNEAGVRGFSAVCLLLVDEAARVEDGTYLAMRPMLAVSNGTMWLMSTPFGKRGFFYEAWTDGGEEWERVRVPAEACPRIRREFLEEERWTMGERWFRQEYLCEFVDTVGGIFDREVVHRAITHEVKPLEFD
jgi:hypothetical protein